MNKNRFEVVHSEGLNSYGILYNDEVIVGMDIYPKPILEALVVPLNQVKAALPKAPAMDVYRFVVNQIELWT